MVWEAEARGVPISRWEAKYNYNIIQMMFILSYYTYTFLIHLANEEDKKCTLPDVKI